MNPATNSNNNFIGTARLTPYMSTSSISTTNGNNLKSKL
jgi:hypothetical protein